MELYYSYENVNLLIILIGVILILHMVTLKKIKKRTVLFANYELLEKAMGKKIFRKNYIPLILRSAAVIMIILAISNLTITVVMNVADVDFVLALDTSPTMSTSDNGNFTPNRLGAAKDSAIMVMNSVPKGTNFGLVSFSGKSYRKKELTDNHDELKDSIRSLGFEGPAGTATGDAIITASTMLSNTTKKKVVALLTDGESNEGVSVNESLKYAMNYNIIIYTIGIGPRNETEANASIEIPEYLIGKNATTYSVPLLDENALMDIANKTGGKYYHVTNETELDSAFYGAVLRANSIEINARKWALLFAIFLLMMEWGLGATKYKTIP